VRVPQKGSGHVRLPLCTQEGTLEQKLVTRRSKEAYRAAKDAEWGSPWDDKNH
jgi:ribosomal protein RSM22 (predicted rRNA methylase)